MKNFFITLLIILFCLAFIMFSLGGFMFIYEDAGFSFAYKCLFKWGLFIIMYAIALFILFAFIRDCIDLNS